MLADSAIVKMLLEHGANIHCVGVMGNDGVYARICFWKTKEPAVST